MTPLCAWLRVLTSESGILLATDGASYQQREWVRQAIEAMRDALAALDARPNEEATRTLIAHLRDSMLHVAELSAEEVAGRFELAADELEAALDAHGQTPDDPAIDCPLCGARVRQVASATLSLALWQHVNWACPNYREAVPGPAPTPDRTAEEDR